MKNKYNSIYAPYLTDFVALKRSLGFKYDEGEKICTYIDRFLFVHANSEIGITKELADKWAQYGKDHSATYQYEKLSGLRQFSEYLISLGFQSHLTQLPKSPDYSYHPYIFTREEIEAVFKVCDGSRLRQRRTDSILLIMPCLLRVLYATGIRIGEALALKNEDVDLSQKCMAVKNTKNGRNRLVPFAESLALVFSDYLQNRARLPIKDVDKKSNAFFMNAMGLPCRDETVRLRFHQIMAKANIKPVGLTKNVRLHDFRHSFACHSFVKLANEGLDLYCSWPYLSTYLGHESLSMTEQYIRITEQSYPDMLKGSEQLYANILRTGAGEGNGGL